MYFRCCTVNYISDMYHGHVAQSYDDEMKNWRMLQWANTVIFRHSSLRIVHSAGRWISARPLKSHRRREFQWLYHVSLDLRLHYGFHRNQHRAVWSHPNECSRGTFEEGLRLGRVDTCVFEIHLTSSVLHFTILKYTSRLLKYTHLTHSEIHFTKRHSFRNAIFVF